MCKLRLLFFVSREICIPFSFVANSFFLLLPTVNTLFHFKHNLFITCIGKLLLRSSISYFIWQDLIANLYIYIEFLRMVTYIYTRSSALRGVQELVFSVVFLLFYPVFILLSFLYEEGKISLTHYFD
jgi:hypothetical protein